MLSPVWKTQPHGDGTALASNDSARVTLTLLTRGMPEWGGGTKQLNSCVFAQVLCLTDADAASHPVHPVATGTSLIRWSSAGCGVGHNNRCPSTGRTRASARFCVLRLLATRGTCKWDGVSVRARGHCAPGTRVAKPFA